MYFHFGSWGTRTLAFILHFRGTSRVGAFADDWGYENAGLQGTRTLACICVLLVHATARSHAIRNGLRPKSGCMYSNIHILQHASNHHTSFCMGMFVEITKCRSISHIIWQLNRRQDTRTLRACIFKFAVFAFRHYRFSPFFGTVSVQQAPTLTTSVLLVPISVPSH